MKISRHARAAQYYTHVDSITHKRYTQAVERRPGARPRMQVAIGAHVCPAAVEGVCVCV